MVATIPAAAAYSSLALASAAIGAIERFPRPGSLANYWGLTPGCRNSGEVTASAGLDHQARQCDGTLHPWAVGHARFAA